MGAIGASCCIVVVGGLFQPSWCSFYRVPRYATVGSLSVLFCHSVCTLRYECYYHSWFILAKVLSVRTVARYCWPLDPRSSPDRRWWPWEKLPVECKCCRHNAQSGHVLFLFCFCEVEGCRALGWEEVREKLAVA